MEDKLTDYERAEHYKKLYKSRVGAIFVYSALFFILGFAVARFIYLCLV